MVLSLFIFSTEKMFVLKQLAEMKVIDHLNITNA